MNESLMLSLQLALAWLAGGALGVIFFAGLWWTVRKCISAPQAALWLFGSLMLRIAIILPGFYWVAGGQWQRALACLLGFVMMRLIVIRLVRALPGPLTPLIQERQHAP